MPKKEPFEKDDKILASNNTASSLENLVEMKHDVLLSTFFEDAPHCIFVLDPEFSLLVANAEGRRLCWLTLEQPPGVPLWNVLSKPFGNRLNLQECLVQSFREAISTRVPVTLLLSSTDTLIPGMSEKLNLPGFGLLQKGAGIWHVCHKPVFGSDGRVAGIVTYLMTLCLLDKTFERRALDSPQSLAPATVPARTKGIVPAVPATSMTPVASLISPSSQAGSQDERSVGKCLKVLLVEDNEDLCFATSEQLCLLGHQVTSASDAEQAQQHLAGGKFDLLFTDLTLPKMTGADLARYVLHHFPHMHVVITSGYGRAMADVNDLDALFLPKPYRHTDLQNLLWRVADDCI